MGMVSVSGSRAPILGAQIDRHYSIDELERLMGTRRLTSGLATILPPHQPLPGYPTHSVSQ